MIDVGDNVLHLESGGSVDGEDFGVSACREYESEIGFVLVDGKIVEVGSTSGCVIECRRMRFLLSDDFFREGIRVVS
jgi:hypothetical protein